MKVLRKRKRLVFLTLVAVGLVVGCTSIKTMVGGIDFDDTKVGQIVKGKTVKNKIIELWGEPIEKKLDEQGMERWIYSYMVKKAAVNEFTEDAEGTVRVKKLEIIFDEDVVKKYIYFDSNVPAYRTETMSSSTPTLDGSIFREDKSKLESNLKM